MEYVTINNMHISKLTLGTAQLGVNYGIANKTGKLNYQAAKEILKVAANHGINCFDTAPSYGDSEEYLGSFLQGYPNFSLPPVVITKLPQLNLMGKLTRDNVLRLVRKHVLASVARLKVKSLPIYLLHHASDMSACDGLVMENLLQLHSEGLVGCIGVSVYTEKEVELALTIKAIKAIQVPINIFDHRLIRRGLLEQLKEKNFIVFARSVFLQGLFFLDPDKLPPGLEPAKKPLRQLHQLSHTQEIGIAKMALTFVRDLPGITSLVIGAETPNQVLEDIKIMKSPPLSSKLREEIMSTFSDLPLELINPSLWDLTR